jgi:beta-galactosidase
MISSYEFLPCFLNCQTGALKYWRDRRNVSYLDSESAVWNDEAVSGALESAAFWSEGLPYARSLSGYWKFCLAQSPESVPEKFYDAEFNDSDWEALPGTMLPLLACLMCF